MGLAEKSCVPCRGGVPPLAGEEIERYLPELKGWTVIEGKRLEKSLTCPDFAASLALANEIGALAEEQGHHPDLLVAWGRLGIQLWTHKVDGLTESDFILAAKIDRIADR